MEAKIRSAACEDQKSYVRRHCSFLLQPVTKINVIGVPRIQAPLKASAIDGAHHFRRHKVGQRKDDLHCSKGGIDRLSLCWSYWIVCASTES